MKKMKKPSFLDRYRWWLFLSYFGIRAVLLILKNIKPEFSGIYVMVGFLAVVPLVAGIVGFFVHRRDRRWIEADAQYRQAKGTQEQSE